MEEEARVLGAVRNEEELPLGCTKALPVEVLRARGGEGGGGACGKRGWLKGWHVHRHKGKMCCV